MAEEIWKDLNGFDGVIQLSSTGRFRRFVGGREKKIVPVLHKSGNLFLHFTYRCKCHTILAAKLILDHFQPREKDKINICYKDGDKQNISADNLYWGDALDSITQLNGEIWRDVVGYEGLYKVSNKGRVLSIGRRVGNCHLSAKLMRFVTNPSGYYMVVLGKDGISKGYVVHRLVAQAFIPNPDNKMIVDHIDTNRKNNNLDNLRWCTPQENSNNRTTIKKLKKKKAFRNPNSIQILRVALSDASIRVYASLVEAIKENPMDYATLKKCLSGGNLPYKGYRWYYLHGITNNKVKYVE